jgi:hypothetical protein
MLKDLDKIDWKSRNASEVPVWLHQLCSSDLSVAYDAWDRLDGYIVKVSNQDHRHGNGISRILNTDVPLLIVPFLIEILDSNIKIGKTDILTLLIGLSSYEYMNDEGDAYSERARQIFDAVWEGHPLYLSLLRYPESQVRLEAVLLLSKFKNHSNVILPHLQRAISHEQEPDVKKQMIQQVKESFPNERF